jgi:two-component system, sensor histidine kinase and response regulator
MANSDTKLGQIRVLVADDDPILREFAYTHLSSPDTEVVTAGDGAEALSVLQKQAFDIALVDLDMPVMSGFELIAAIRANAQLAHLPVIVITGREDMVAIDEAFAAGANSFVVKPLNWLLLSHQISYVLRNARTEQELRKARDQVQSADRIKANILRLMRHEFNTPLNAISGFSKIIAETADDPTIQHHAEDVIASARDLKQVSEDLFSAVTAISGELKIVKTRVCVAEVLQSASETALLETRTKATRLRILNRTDDVEISADFASLKLAIGHLVRNGLTHGSRGEDPSPVLLVANAQPETNTLVLSVIDHGPGIPTHMLESVTSAFIQVETALTRSSHGLGLGLAVAKAHIAALGGHLHLTNRDDATGLVATVVLPNAIVVPVDVPVDRAA